MPVLQGFLRAHFFPDAAPIITPDVYPHADFHSHRYTMADAPNVVTNVRADLDSKQARDSTACTKYVCVCGSGIVFSIAKCPF